MHGCLAAPVIGLDPYEARWKTGGNHPALDIRPLAEPAAGAPFPLPVTDGFVGSFILRVALSVLRWCGSVSYSVGHSTREFGIRAVLGATPSSRRLCFLARVESGISTEKVDSIRNFGHLFDNRV